MTVDTMMVDTMIVDTMMVDTEKCLIMPEIIRPMGIIMESVWLPSDGLNTPMP